jgi:hypothetical protein
MTIQWTVARFWELGSHSLGTSLGVDQSLLGPIALSKPHLDLDFLLPTYLPLLHITNDANGEYFFKFGYFKYHVLLNLKYKLQH